jgi:NAD(P)-dependent dehydrogenase (short-subunit alcohol dehydrogenase family)
MADKKIALVTGGNKGLGLEIVKQLAEKGYTVLLAAREDKAQEPAKQLAAEGLDVVPVRLDVTSLQDITNVIGPFELTRHLLPLLKKSPAGRIVNQSSILGSLATMAGGAGAASGFLFAGYSSSKAALNMITVVLSEQLKDTNIKVNTAHPGWVKTDMGGPGAQLEIPEGAKTAVELATLPDDGPTGSFQHLGKTLPW